MNQANSGRSCAHVQAGNHMFHQADAGRVTGRKQAVTRAGTHPEAMKTLSGS